MRNSLRAASLDLSRKPESRCASRDRKFVEIYRDNFDACFRA